MNIPFLELVFFMECYVSINAVIEFCGFKTAFRSKTINAKSLWDLIGVWDKVACSVACMKDVNCETFIYSLSMKTCLGYPMSLDYYKNLLTEVKDGDHIVVRTCRVSVQHGKPCYQNDNCLIKDSICFRGMCLCRPGLYFSSKQNACLKECIVYDGVMDIYEGASIKGHNEMQIPHPVSLPECCEECAKEKTFTCKTVDWREREGLCNLSRYGYLEVPQANREANLSEWSLAQRRCK